ncbi:hypothetical protein ACFCWD_31305 [Streptomyces sp. NPDC056374]|uniref:hypothetical protein n=1 Tax=unclassified Streptomyces TaxID=2593676 RepID=UPI0035DCDD7A
MSEDTEIGKEIRALKEALYLYHESLVTVKYDTDHQEKDPAKQAKDETFMVSKLKASLIDEQPRIVTDAMLPFEFVKRFAEMYEELQKEKSSELFEAFGLDGVGAAIEKYYEGHEARLQYAIVAALGLIVPLAIGALLVVFQRKALEIFRGIQLGITGRAVVTNENQNGFERLTRQEITDREANAGGGMASIPRDADFNPLRLQLEALNPHLRDFNTLAGPFKTKFKDLPKASVMAAAADGVDKINTAVAAANPTQIELVAKAIVKLVDSVKDYNPKKIPDPKKLDKLNTAMAGADPAKIREVASATGKLAGAQRHFDPKKLPKAGGLASAARSAERLADAGRDVAQAFNTLRLAAQRTAAEI